MLKRGGALRAVINGKEVLTYKDAEPIAVCRVGIGGYDTSMNFSGVLVRELDTPADQDNSASAE